MLRPTRPYLRCCGARSSAAVLAAAEDVVPAAVEVLSWFAAALTAVRGISCVPPAGGVYRPDDSGCGA